MSTKQDRARVRTATDLEQKYNFGKTFADVYGLVTDAQKAAEAAQKAVDSLDHEQIFNLLTDNGKVQGIYRGDDGDVYINASYVKSGKIAAEFIDAENLTVKAANITGEITFTQLDETLQEAIENSTLPDYITETYIDSTTIKSPIIEGGKITGMEIFGGKFSDLTDTSWLDMNTYGDSTSSGAVLRHMYPAYSATFPLMAMGYIEMAGETMWALMVENGFVIAKRNGIIKAYGTWDFSGATVTGI